MLKESSRLLKFFSRVFFCHLLPTLMSKFTNSEILMTQGQKSVQRDLLANLEGSINLNLNLQGGNVEDSINLEGHINLNRKEFPFSRPDGSVWPQWTSAIFFSCGMQINKTENPSNAMVHPYKILVCLAFFVA